jgi:tRNA(fMet)-specific endonuclease VapC
MPSYLLDINAFSHAARGTSSLFNRRFESISLRDIAISVVSEAELLFGIARRPEAHVLAASIHGLLRRITILPWTSKCAAEYAVLRAQLEGRGTPMGNMDMMIAAHALAEDCIVVTNDAAFSRIGHLRTENW